MYFDESLKAIATREAFGRTLEELGADERIVVLDSDLSKSTQTQHFAKKYPDRFFNLGIAEANMIGVAAGLARSGKIPFAASFACFLTGRFDQIRMSVAFSNAPVRLVGTHAGVGIGEDGHSQMGLEDLALMRSLPEMLVFQPSDEDDTKRFIEWSMDDNHAAYMRLTRQKCPAIKRDKKSKMEPGVWDVLSPLTKDSIVIMSSGGAFAAAAEAAQKLVDMGKEVCLVNAHWIKPLDDAFIRDSIMAEAKLLVTVEDHYSVGGLGGAVAEEISGHDSHPCLLRLGVEDFGQSGSPKDNCEYYGLTRDSIAAKILEAVRD